MRLEELRTKYRDHILTIAAKHRAENVRVFGSIVRGDARESSDIDLLVHFQPGSSLFDYGGLQYDLEQLLGKVDVVDDDAVKDRHKKRIFEEAVSL